MESEFNKYGVKNIRIPAYSGLRYKEYTIVKQEPTNKSEIGCLCSHIKALEYFVNTDLGDYCLIAEDDLSFDYVQYWKRNFWDYIGEIPKDFEIIQLVQTYSTGHVRHSIMFPNQSVVMLRPQRYQRNIWGAVCYLIKKSAAQKLLASLPKRGPKYYLGNLVEKCSEPFLFSSLIGYTIPLFSSTHTFDSTIHQNHVERIHVPSSTLVTQLWMNEAR